MTQCVEDLYDLPTGYKTTKPTSPTVWVFSCPNAPQTPANGVDWVLTVAKGPFWPPFENDEISTRIAPT